MSQPGNATTHPMDNTLPETTRREDTMKEQPTPTKTYMTTMYGQEVEVKVYAIDPTPPKKVSSKKPSTSKG